jgi:hypothetical protein
MAVYICPAGCYDDIKKIIIYHSSDIDKCTNYLLEIGYHKNQIMIPTYITLEEKEKSDKK